MVSGRLAYTACHTHALGLAGIAETSRYRSPCLKVFVQVLGPTRWSLLTKCAFVKISSLHPALREPFQDSSRHDQNLAMLGGCGASPPRSQTERRAAAQAHDARSGSLGCPASARFQCPPAIVKLWLLWARPSHQSRHQTLAGQAQRRAAHACFAHDGHLRVVITPASAILTKPPHCCVKMRSMQLMRRRGCCDQWSALLNRQMSPH